MITQGDVISITDADGNVVAEYSYDAWGVPTVISDTSGKNISTYNPYRYRSYYYDRETGLYYLQSRYYDPMTGRFVNSDDALMLLFYPKHRLNANLFVYVGNNPVCNVDVSGYIATNIVSGIIGALLNVIIDFITSALSYWVNNKFSLKGFKYNLHSYSTALAAATGFAAGLIISSTYSKWVCAIGGGVINGITNIISSIIKKKKPVIKDVLIDVAFGLIWGYFGGNGVGKEYFRKNIFSKGGSFVYKGNKYYSSASLKLIKPVIKDFAKAFAIYTSTQILDWFQKFARGKA